MNFDNCVLWWNFDFDHFWIARWTSGNSHSHELSFFANLFLYRLRSSTVLLILIERDIFQLLVLLINLFLTEEFGNVTTKRCSLVETSCFLPSRYNFRKRTSSISMSDWLPISALKRRILHWLLILCTMFQ